MTRTRTGRRRFGRTAGAGTIVLLLAVSALTLTRHACAQQPRTTGGAVLAELGSDLTGRVTRVFDGDTLELILPDGRGVRVRLEGIDCPERRQPFSNVSRNFTRQLAFDRTVTVKVHDVDRYGRLVARVTSDGKDLSWELVSAGLAWHYTRYSNDPKLAAAEAEAKKNRRGMWADRSTNPSSPMEEPRPLTTPVRPLMAVPAGAFVGNTRSRVYHAPTCRNAGCPNCTERFDTESEARAAGFRPAGDCLKSRR